MVANNDKAAEITGKQFDETINNSKQKVVVVDFFAEWCMPCVILSPIIEELAAKFKNVKFVKVNVDESHSLSSKMGVSSIPTLIVFKQGKEIDRIKGALPEEVLEEKIKKYSK